MPDLVKWMRHNNPLIWGDHGSAIGSVIYLIGCYWVCQRVLVAYGAANQPPRANTTATTFPAPPSRSALLLADAVVPVVNTSSTIQTVQPLARTGI
ncbi:MAG: hypothetical protein EBS30_15215 [Planctomycetes bacterium]|nr:hypothetical protein [Planctomycetota bacterium]